MTDGRPVFVSTGCLRGVEPLADRLARFYQHGLDAIELSGGVSIGTDDLARLPVLKRPFLIHNYFPPPAEPFVVNLASPSDAIRQKSLQFVRSALDLSSRLGAAFYSVHAGFITDPTGREGGGFAFSATPSPEEAERAVACFVASLTAAEEDARRHEVTLLVENNVCREALRGKLLLQTAGEFVALSRTWSSPHLGVLVDTGHLNVTAHTFGFDPLSFIDQVAPWIRAFHVHDNDGTVDGHQPVAEDSWVLGVLRRREFRHLPIIVEAQFDDVVELREHVDWLAAVLQDG